MAKKPKKTEKVQALETTEAGALRVWHIPQIPMIPFHVKVTDVAQAKLVLKTLAAYDLFQYENKVKGDYANAQGLEVLEDFGGGPEWCEWHDEDDRDIIEVMREESR